MHSFYSYKTWPFERFGPILRYTYTSSTHGKPRGGMDLVPEPPPTECCATFVQHDIACAAPRSCDTYYIYSGLLISTALCRFCGGRGFSACLGPKTVGTGLPTKPHRECVPELARYRQPRVLCLCVCHLAHLLFSLAILGGVFFVVHRLCIRTAQQHRIGDSVDIETITHRHHVNNNHADVDIESVKHYP